tara:strand:+ start:486 stop:596 length:111 start_codon:yes stop_codon:yes gene_type:complete
MTRRRRRRTPECFSHPAKIYFLGDDDDLAGAHNSEK